jgi:hypothetical protein
MTAEEFERQYAERSGITVERLRELGRIVAPCDCGEDICEGWQSTTAERLLGEMEYRLPSNCLYCGAVLKGGATVHAPACEIRKLIEANFPRKEHHA